MTSSASYSAAISALRTPQGHNASNPSGYSNPVKFASYDSALSSVDTTSEKGARPRRPRCPEAPLF